MSLFTDRLTVTYSGNGVAVTSAIVAKTGDADAGFDNSVATATTNGRINVAFTIVGLKMCILASDQDVDLYTNDVSGGSPQEHIALKAGAPLVYYVGGPWAIPFAGAVTAFYVTNASGQPAHLQIRVLYDSTPVLP